MSAPSLFSVPAEMPPRRLQWPVLAAVAAVGAALLIFGLWSASRPVSNSEGEPATARNSSLDLRASENGNLVDIGWNREAPAIARSERGVLSIENGTFAKEVDLTRDQLRTGKMVFSRLPAAATLKLAVFAKDREAVSQGLELEPLEQEAAAPVAAIPASHPAVVAHSRPAKQVRAARHRGARVRTVAHGKRQKSNASHKRRHRA